ncbi:MAG TPA: DinB family protein [Candidatus Limnocylindrales bacterium]|nr:DinB family protein [Candidatus Limnocylindrales bacterium]
MKRHVLLIALAAAPLLAQDFTNVLAQHWKTSGEFTVAVAKTMPAELYNTRPNPAEMSFGMLMAHIGAANVGACATASGLPRPEMPAGILKAVRNPKENEPDVPKDEALPFLQSSFDFCNKAVAAMTPEKLSATVGGTRKMTGFEWLWSYFTHTAHHRGQAEVYMRLKGIKPPDYAF